MEAQKPLIELVFLENKIKMKNILAILFILQSTYAASQNLTLTELQNLCKQSNWENGANILTRKGWEYHNSKRGDTYEYSTISYAYGKDTWYDDRATAWFRFYTYNGRVEEVDYQPTDNAYKSIKATLSANGYKQTDSKIYDKAIAAFYSSPSFILVIQTSTQERAYGGGTMVSYIITLTRKGGIYDNDNGEKVDYYYGTTKIKERYTLKDGKKNGKCYSYFEDGTLESVITYVNGKGNGSYIFYNENGKPRISGTLLNDEKNGIITEYNEYGDKNIEYTTKNGKANGKFTVYHYNGKIRATGNYLNEEKDGLITEFDTDGKKANECYYKSGEKDGLCKEYAYNDDGELALIISGNYKNDEKDGYWETKVLKDGKWHIAVYSNYSNGTLHGAAKEWQADCDSVVFCNYNYGKLEGKYQEKRRFLGAGFLFDDGNLYTDVDGQYYNGKKTGHWTYRNKMMQKEVEGDFVNGYKEGLWYYYYINQLIESIANYHNGKLDGKFIKIKEDYLFNKTLDPSSLDFIKKDIKDSIDYICYYKNGELNGHYEKHDNDGNIIAEGDFYNNLRNGRWTEIDIADDTKWMSNYVNGKLYGVCERFSPSFGKTHTYNYKNGVLDGRQVWYQLRTNSPLMESEFKNGHLQKQTVYKEDKTKSSEFKLTKEGTTSFNGSIIAYYSEQDNSEIGKIVGNYYFNIHPDSILSRPFIIIANTDNKQKNGKMQIFDHQNRIVIDGTYTYGKQSGNWIYSFYNQNLYYIINHDNESAPWLFYTYGSDTPYSGKFTRPETNGGTSVIAVYKIKKSLIEEIVYTDPTTGKTIKKEKYKNGLPIE